VALLLGHKDLRMAARYQHLSPDFLADAAGKLDGVFGEFSAHSDAASHSEIGVKSGATCHQSVTAPKALPAVVSVSA